MFADFNAIWNEFITNGSPLDNNALRTKKITKSSEPHKINKGKIHSRTAKVMTAARRYP
ncbi:MAG: hypothetical protein NC299_01285 [Lachnospiraceae bacterium]|nr:hypothetical protein [Ruminococcus sp.]MCM1273982.1 hypothetical protein [Lachnospiraceae bacterium]